MNTLLRDWLDPQGAFNQISFVWLGPWSTWMISAALITIAATLWLGWHNAKRLSARRRISLTTLRAGALLTFFILFMQPAARLEDVSRVKNHVAILLDTSRSMGLPQDANIPHNRADQSSNQSRAQAAMKALEGAQGVIDEWTRAHHVDYFGFDSHLQGAPHLAGLTQRELSGDQTSLINSLTELAARYDPQDLAAVILLSDGSDQASIGKIDPPLKLMAAAERLGVPIHTFGVGPHEPALDFALAEVRADEFAFARNAVSVDVDLRVSGARSPLSQRVALYRGAELLSERVLFTEVGKTSYSLSFSFVPEETGEEAYSVVVDPHPREQVRTNNIARFSMRVIRDKIRVLQVVGNPSWDQRFLRKHLKKNPNVELISFFILRTNASIETARPDELSLIPFPTQELFEERLGSFDLMIFQDFTHRGYRMRRYLPLIRDYVRAGGGFVMVGGDQSFSGGGYAGTAIEEILPVQLYPNSQDLVDLGRFSPTLGEVGARHPITSLSLSPEENSSLWASLPELEGTNRVARVKRGAQVLAWRPPLKAGSPKTPLIVASDIDKGRALTVMTDSMWRWALSPESIKSDQGARAYHRFWGNAIRWLIRDPALNPLQVRADRDRYQTGVTAQITARALDASYQPTRGAKVLVVVEEISEGLSRAREVYRSSGESSAEGEVSLTWRPQEPGAYRIRASSSLGGVDREASDLLVVEDSLAELRDIAPRPDLLKAISDVSNGQTLSAGDDWSQLTLRQAAVTQINRRDDVALWATWWALLIALAFPTVEWALRRRWGLS